MIRGTFAFAWLWTPDWWATRTAELARSRKGLVETATRLVEARIDKASRDRFLLAVTELVNDTLVPTLATRAATTLPEDTTERRIIRAMVRRDFLYTWLLSPSWRAQLSYQQLVQSRLWVRRIARGADPLAQPLIADLCDLEGEIQRLADRHIEETFNPALLKHLNELTRQLREGSSEDRAAVVTSAVFLKLRETVLEMAVDAYTELVGIGGHGT